MGPPRNSQTGDSTLGPPQVGCAKPRESAIRRSDGSVYTRATYPILVWDIHPYQVGTNELKSTTHEIDGQRKVVAIRLFRDAGIPNSIN